LIASPTSSAERAVQRAGPGDRTAYALAGGRVTGRADAAARDGDEDVTFVPFSVYQGPAKDRAGL